MLPILIFVLTHFDLLLLKHGEIIKGDPLHEGILDLVEHTEKLLMRQSSDPRQRALVALAGVPGSGKSTVSQALVAELASRGVAEVAVVPMDGFHYTQRMLSVFKDSELAFRRRGAPFTFDGKAFVKLVQTIKTTPVTTNEDPEFLIPAPSFNHAIKDPVQGGILVPSSARLVIIEGNYTLLNESPWNRVAEACDEKWFVDAPLYRIKERLTKRHLNAGIETSAAAAAQRAEENDIPNGELIRTLLIKPDVIIEN
ncbi:phosphoribulokinase/uridine kinase [Pyrenochaeta sp. MPI-SDFR-AT-0127]|nr:phosphoribulokinase/uridine kinase [Pyrenochaeta sp. MPI-SDFR-AT-0127]